MMWVPRFADDSESCRFAGSPFSLPGSPDVVGILKTRRALLITSRTSIVKTSSFSALNAVGVRHI